MDSPDNKAILFSSRANVDTYSGDGAFTETTFGTIALDRETLIVDGGRRLLWVEVDCIKRRFGGIEIKHHSSRVPKTILAWKFRLFRRLQDAV